MHRTVAKRQNDDGYFSACADKPLGQAYIHRLLNKHWTMITRCNRCFSFTHPVVLFTQNCSGVPYALILSSVMKCYLYYGTEILFARGRAGICIRNLKGEDTERGWV